VYWWSPIAIGVAFTPVAIVLVVLSHGAGHGTGFWEDALFPLYRPLRILLDSDNAASISLFFTQYVTYGALVAFAIRRRRSHWQYIGTILAFHAACYAIVRWF